MTETERRVTEEQIAGLKARLNDPWRLLRWAEKGVDQILVLAETRSLESMISDLEAQLAAHQQS